MAQVTIEQLLSKKIKDEVKNTKEFVSHELQGEITINKIPIEKVLRLMDGANQNDILSGYALNQQLIYECCPIFKNKELQAAHEGLVEPFEIVGKVLNDNIGEISRLSEAIMQFYGLNSEDLSAAVKKQ